MKKWLCLFLVFCFLKGSSCLAAVFLAPSADAEAYDRYLVQRNQQSYTQSFQQEIEKKEAEAHTQVSEFVQRVLSESAPLSESQKNEWENLRLALELNKEDRELLALLAEKKTWNSELCRALLLEANLRNKLEKANDVPDCKKPSRSVSTAILQLIEPKDLLLIDGVIFSRDSLPKVLMGGSYHWRLLSNRFVDRYFTGTPEGFLQALQSRTPWVEGDCANAKLNHPDFSVLTQSKVYFSDECVPPGMPPVRSFGTWASEHKKLLWGAGIVLGIIVVTQVRDKNLVITTP